MAPFEYADEDETNVGNAPRKSTLPQEGLVPHPRNTYNAIVCHRMQKCGHEMDNKDTLQEGDSKWTASCKLTKT